MSRWRLRCWPAVLVTLLWCCGDSSGPVTEAPGDSGAAACGDCHGMPPSSGKHEFHAKILECSSCHACVVDGTRTIIDATRHNDGKQDVCNNKLVHDPGTNTCDNIGCHPSRKW